MNPNQFPLINYPLITLPTSHHLTLIKINAMKIKLSDLLKIAAMPPTKLSSSFIYNVPLKAFAWKIFSMSSVLLTLTEETNSLVLSKHKQNLSFLC